MSTSIPEPWLSAMSQRGLNSIRALSRRSDVSVETVRRLVQGSRKTPKDETLRAVAEALDLPIGTVSDWAGIAASDIESPYTPPSEANRLGQREREAVDELIRLLASRGADERPERPDPRPLASVPADTPGLDYGAVHDALDAGEYDAVPFAAGNVDENDGVDQQGPATDEDDWRR